MTKKAISVQAPNNYDNVHALLPKAYDENTIAKLEAGLHKLAEATGSSVDTISADFLLSLINADTDEKEMRIATDAFTNVFINKLQTSEKKYIIPIFVFAAEGIGDLNYGELLRPDSPNVDWDQPNAGYEFHKDVYNRAVLDIPLFIVGQTGTSKGLLAKAIHKMSNRRNGPYEDINCTGLTEQLLESTLFGHIKGAFTDATANKTGLFESATGGTVFLDELGKMSIHLQAKILKAVEEGKVRKVGDNKTYDINIRILAAAHERDVESSRRILPDLKYRLGYPDMIYLPTLSERLKDGRQFVLANILKTLMKKLKTKTYSPDYSIEMSNSEFDELTSLPFEGNFRELENILRSAILSSEPNPKQVITYVDIKKAMQKKSRPIRQDNMESKIFLGISTDKMRVRDLIDEIDKSNKDIAKKTIEGKLIPLLEAGKKLKTILRDEGLDDSKYQNYRKKILSRLGDSMLKNRIAK